MYPSNYNSRESLMSLAVQSLVDFWGRKINLGIISKDIQYLWWHVSDMGKKSHVNMIILNPKATYTIHSILDILFLFEY